jgi:uncharacterized protein YbjT (DUF2867 family)
LSDVTRRSTRRSNRGETARSRQPRNRCFSKATVHALAAAGVDVIAGVHSLDKSGSLEQLGAIVKQFDFADVPGLTSAMLSADRLFLVTPVSQDTEKPTSSIVEAAKAASVVRIAKIVWSRRRL